MEVEFFIFSDEAQIITLFLVIFSYERKIFQMHSIFPKWFPLKLIELARKGIRMVKKLKLVKKKNHFALVPEQVFEGCLSCSVLLVFIENFIFLHHKLR